MLLRWCDKLLIGIYWQDVPGFWYSMIFVIFCLWFQNISKSHIWLEAYIYIYYIYIGWSVFWSGGIQWITAVELACMELPDTCGLCSLLFFSNKLKSFKDVRGPVTLGASRHGSRSPREAQQSVQSFLIGGRNLVMLAWSIGFRKASSPMT
jgi:hypothetical protein